MISRKLIDSVCANLEEELPVNEVLPEQGYLHIDKLLPYICVYRFKQTDAYFSGLLKTQASFLIVKDTVDISELLECLSQTITEKLNAFLIIELWPLRKDHEAEFEILCPQEKAPATVGALEEGINEMRVIYPELSVKVNDTHDRHPEHLNPLLDLEASKKSGSLIIGMGVPTIYERPEENEVYSIFYRKFYTRFSELIKRAVYEFIRVQTANPYEHYLMLGKTNLDKFTLDADEALAEISEGMSFLLRTTPVNSAQEWEHFKKSDFKEKPAFTYRLIPLDPEQEKRKLYDIKVDKIDDPTIAYILRDKRLEIEKQLTMLEERGTDSFRFIGESLYGKVEERTLEEARNLLKQFPQPEHQSNEDLMDCHQFAEQASKELSYYQEQFPTLDLNIEIRKDIAGIMVSETNLYISTEMSLDANRCEALIQHEIGTHILTYCNGRSQPLRQMYTGFAGYDQLQEGLAVLAEILVGGVTINRIRLLAGRVLASESMTQGATFIETFTMLHQKYNFPEKTAYYISMRIYRGGGLTKDAVYLAGLLDVLEYVKNGGNLETLYTGKFNVNHVPLIEELLHRSVLRKPILPRFLQRSEVQNKLSELRNGIALTDILN